MIKRIRKVKWENIVSIAMTIIAIQKLLLTINCNGITTNTYVEIAFGGLAVIGSRYLIKDLRVNPTNWLIDK